MKNTTTYFIGSQVAPKCLAVQTIVHGGIERNTINRCIPLVCLILLMIGSGKKATHVQTIIEQNINPVD